jgi:hypothetical protein
MSRDPGSPTCSVSLVWPLMHWGAARQMMDLFDRRPREVFRCFHELATELDAAVKSLMYGPQPGQIFAPSAGERDTSYQGQRVGLLVS